jgi:hypothetical protein
MSNLPDIFAFCAAGCKWKVPHLSDFNDLKTIVENSVVASGSYVGEGIGTVNYNVSVVSVSGTDEITFTKVSTNYREIELPFEPSALLIMVDGYSTLKVIKNTNITAYPIFNVYKDGIRNYTSRIGSINYVNTINISGNKLQVIGNAAATCVSWDMGAAGEESRWTFEFDGMSASTSDRTDSPSNYFDKLGDKYTWLAMK